MNSSQKIYPFVLLFLLLLVTACSPALGTSSATPPARPARTATLTPHSTGTTAAADTGVCPVAPGLAGICYTPLALRNAYAIEPLTRQGYTGAGQTIIDIVSYGSPTLQQDMDVFDKEFGLPPITIQILSPLGTIPFDSNNKDMPGWAAETELDVQIMHAVAPGARIVVMTSPVDETEGTIGLPQFLQLEQYAVTHHLGQIFSQSYAASEVTLADSAGRQLVKTYADFYQQITTKQGITALAGSGDNGATDWGNLAATTLSATPTVNFPADVPWVTAVGGTTLTRNGESAWSRSGGGLSQFFSEPDFQRGLPQSAQKLLNGQRGLPDIAADADPFTGMAFYLAGQWEQVGGTSASTPLWAAIIAIADQMAGHPLGDINPDLYKLGESPNASRDFRDVTSGSNAVNRGTIHLAGFQAQPGWDAVTGWGTPIVSQFIPDLIAALK